MSEPDGGGDRAMTERQPRLAPRSLIVSCQPSDLSPLRGPQFAAALARAAELGGAAAVRADGPADVAAVRHAVSIPVVGIWTVVSDGYPVYITPDFGAARALATAGADIIAIDATGRPRAGGESAGRLIARIRDDLGLLVEADVDAVEEARLAASCGADFIGSSVTGYVRTTGRREPDIDLVRRLVDAVDRPVIAQRRLWTIEHVRAALDSGAHAVVVGSAITDPVQLTRHFVEAIAMRGAPPRS
jgi:N-acylglucosamine-6-phosphate 2-epimerase